jgi:hypothetical protein
MVHSTGAICKPLQILVYSSLDANVLDLICSFIYYNIFKVNGLALAL